MSVMGWLGGRVGVEAFLKGGGKSPPTTITTKLCRYSPLHLTGEYRMLAAESTSYRLLLAFANALAFPFATLALVLVRHIGSEAAEA